MLVYQRVTTNQPVFFMAHFFFLNRGTPGLRLPGDSMPSFGTQTTDAGIIPEIFGRIDYFNMYNIYICEIYIYDKQSFYKYKYCF